MSLNARILLLEIKTGFIVEANTDGFMIYPKTERFKTFRRYDSCC